MKTTCLHNVDTTKMTANDSVQVEAKNSANQSGKLNFRDALRQIIKAKQETRIDDPKEQHYQFLC